MTDLGRSRQPLPDPASNNPTRSEPTTDQLTSATLISSVALTVSGEQKFMESGEHVHTVETDEASIKFFGGVSHGSFSSSESEEEIEENCRSDDKRNDPNESFIVHNSDIHNQQSVDSDHLDRKTVRVPEDPISGNFGSNNSKLTTNFKFNSYNSDSGNFHSENKESDVNIPVVDNTVCVNGITLEQHNDFNSSPNTAELSSEEHIHVTSEQNPENNNGEQGSQHGTGHNDRMSSHAREDECFSPASSNSTFDSSYVDRVSRMREDRFNPFDRDVVFEEDYFGSGTLRQATSSISDSRDCSDEQPVVSENSRPYSFSSASMTSDSFSMCSPDHLSGDDEFSFADLGLAEDHFSRPEGHFGMSTLEELEMAMENCKDMIREAPPHTDKHKTLVRKLVQLRMKYQQYKDGPEQLEPDVKLVVGHKFKERQSRSSKHYCEKCNAVIWGMLQVWFRCTECGYNCHGKCLNQITRTCASVRVSENPSYILSICPEKGLAYQNYRCAECRAQISFKSGFSEPRLCDYSGNFYCELCHWNDSMIIPARVLHNWDFEPQKVCRAAKQYLRLMTHKAVLRIQDINPMLFNFVEELDDVKKLREEILIMKKYFLSCKSALDSKLLLQLSPRQHCVENSDMYSIKDLVDVQKDLLLPELAKIHSSFAQHIKSDCQLCQAKGFICELCDTHEVLFPFDNIAVVCAVCAYVLHRHCYVKRDNKCPRCERRNRCSEHTTVPHSIIQ